MRYPYRIVFVNGLPAGILLDDNGQLTTCFTRQDYFIDKRFPEALTQGRLADALPDWIDRDVHHAGRVTLGEVMTTDDLPELIAGFSPEAMANWRALRDWVESTIVGPTRSDKPIYDSKLAQFLAYLNHLLR